MHPVHPIVQVLNALSSLGWEELEGEGWPVLLMGKSEFVGDMHFDGSYFVNFEGKVGSDGGRESDLSEGVGLCS
jgi:hypothetical protein